MACPFEDLLALVCRRWPLLVVATIGRGREKRFVELMDDLKGISPRSLAEVLKELTGLGLLTRKEYGEIPPRVGYSLTKQGQELRNAVRPLLEWASETRPEKECPILNAIRAGQR
ncbi:MAG: helix-turn-helix transcriptional regulator [Thaumarchaeota archaeon]|nr:helix-turn-helix transcriptional regulator [Nitrososphaerota archaeon]MBI3023271.1 helix-turn-helix transcriptional regulator [Nitrososphaerota archaeon]